MEKIVLVTFAVILIALIGFLIWVLKTLKNIKQDYQRLSDEMARYSKDIAGLCSAAISVDSQLVESRYKQNEINEKLGQFKGKGYTSESQSLQIDEPPIPDNAIQKIQEGASVDDLIRFSGLSREEALLMIRLHRKK